MKTKYLIAIMLLLLTLSFLSTAQIPRTLSYQGVLSDSSGVPKPDGSYALTFRLYDLSTGGSAIWTETKTLKTNRGLFNTIMGDKSPFDSLTFNKPYWLGIQVGTDPEISSRIPLTSVAYSLNTNNGSGFSNFMIFYSSGTFTVRQGVSKIMVEMWGGGGGGGGGVLFSLVDSTLMFIGGGGGGGGYAKHVFESKPGTNYNIIVGMGGAGGSPSFDSAASGSGGNGGTTRFGSISVTGGGGGDGGGYDFLRKRHLPGVGGGGGKQDEGIAFICVTGGDGGWAKHNGFGGGTGGGGSSINVMNGKEPGGGGASSVAPKGYGWPGAIGRVIVWW